MTKWIWLFVAVDLAVTTAVLLYLARRRAAADPARPGWLLDLGRIRAFSDLLHPQVGEFLRANWSGDPAALPAALATLLDHAEKLARDQGLALEREVLKRVVEHSVGKHKLARSKDVREAMKQVA